MEERANLFCDAQEEEPATMSSNHKILTKQQEELCDSIIVLLLQFSQVLYVFGSDGSFLEEGFSSGSLYLNGIVIHSPRDHFQLFNPMLLGVQRTEAPKCLGFTIHVSETHNSVASRKTLRRKLATLQNPIRSSPRRHSLSADLFPLTKMALAKRLPSCLHQ